MLKQAANYPWAEIPELRQLVYRVEFFKNWLLIGFGH
jgi:hypothetical protein